MEERVVEILCYADIVRVNSPCAHNFSRLRWQHSRGPIGPATEHVAVSSTSPISNALRSVAVVDRCILDRTVIHWMGLNAAARHSISWHFIRWTWGLSDRSANVHWQRCRGHLRGAARGRGAASGEGVPDRLSKHAHPRIRGARCRCVLAKVTRARLGRWQEPHHRVPMGGGERRATTRARGRSGSAQGGCDRCAGRVSCARSKGCDQQHPYCHDLPERSC